MKSLHITVRVVLCSAILLLFPGLSRPVQGQQIQLFSEDPALFIEEVMIFMGTKLNAENQQILSNFQHFWLSGAFSGEEQLRIIGISNEFMARRARPVPQFVNYFSAIYHFKQTSHPQDSYMAWEKGLLSILSDRRNQLRMVDRFMEVSTWLVSEKTLYRSSSTEWKAATDNFTFVYDSVLYVEFGETDLTCYSQRDSGSITGTKGKFFPVTTLWEGEKGIVSWLRAGFSETDVYAELADYTIDMTRSQYRADSVMFYNSYYLKEPLLGVLEDKIVKITSPQRATYPKFDSYTRLFSIEDIYENVDYEGGLSMQGSKLNGSGSLYFPAQLKFFRNDTLFMTIRSDFFVFMSGGLSSSNTQVSVYLEDDSIYHPRIALSYNVENRELSLYRTDDVMMRTPYFNSYHSVDMVFEQLQWKIDEPVIRFTMDKGAALGQARFESNHFFNENQFYRIQAMDEIHPLVVLKRFAEYYYSETFPVEELAKYMRKPKHQIIQLCVRLSTDGFIYFNENTEEVTLKNRLHDYLSAFAGKSDYDVIDFISNTSAPQENALLDLRTMDLTIYGVPQISISDSQNVAIYPRGDKIILKKNRDFSFDGKVNAGLFTFFGEGFTFQYDSFRIALNNIDSLNIAIQSEQYDLYGQHYIVDIKNIIENVTGELLIDQPNNKSGKESFPEYPVFRSNKNSFVYYENVPGLDSIYGREDFFFELEPYTISRLDNFTKEDVSFKGSFKSGEVFPNITQTLLVQEDNSLGFKMETAEEGLPVYGGKGTFFSTVQMSNKGLQGKGRLEFSGSTTVSDNFFFSPDSMIARAKEYHLAESASDDISPMVKATDALVKWFPNEEEWYTYKGSRDITMYNEETRLDGFLRRSRDGLSGKGKMTMPDALLKAEDFRYRRSSFDSDTADFFLQSLRTDAYAFIAENVSAHIDFKTGKGSFSSNNDTSLVKFPENQYVSTLNYFNWNMEVEELAMGQREKTARKAVSMDDSLSILDARLEQPTFVSINPSQKSLGFVSDSAIYNQKENLITAYNVHFIEIADALIFPEGGRVDVEYRARIRLLENATIDANRAHTIHSARVNILDKEQYEASGRYNYTDVENNLLILDFNNIRVNNRGHTIASGDIIEADSFRLSPAFEYIGKVDLDAEKEFMTFTGGVRPVHTCPTLERRFMQFTATIDPGSVMIPVPTEPRDINGNRIFIGNFITNDSTHIYSSFLSRRKTYSDNLITTAEGFLFFDKGTGKYKIGSREKLADESNPGNFITFDRNYCELYGEGKLNPAVEFGQFSLTMVGNTTHNIETNRSTLEVMLALNFFFSPEATAMMSGEIGALPTLEGADITRPAYRKGIAELIGTNKARAMREELSLYGRIAQLPPELQVILFLTRVNLEWNEATSSYRSVGKIGIGNIMNTQLNVMVDGFLEIQKKRSGDLFDVYLKMNDNTWYYFGYSRGVLQSLSSSRDYNALLASMNESQRRLKVKTGETSYIYMVAVDAKLASFLRRFSEGFAGGDGE